MTETEQSNTWRHPTGAVPKKVVLLCLGESKQEYANQLGVSQEAPGWHKEAEIWTLNAGFRIWDHDLLWVMDDLCGEAYKWPGYATDLSGHNRPIITSQTYPGYPSLTYPFREVVERLGLVDMDRWFANSVPYILAYAAFIGVEEIAIFGADYWHPAQRGHEGAIENVHFWLGVLRARGIRVLVPETSTLMGARNTGRQLYGYRYDPRLQMDREQRAEMMRTVQRRQAEPEIVRVNGAPPTWKRMGRLLIVPEHTNPGDIAAHIPDKDMRLTFTVATESGSILQISRGGGTQVTMPVPPPDLGRVADDPPGDVRAGPPTKA